MPNLPPLPPKTIWGIFAISLVALIAAGIIIVKIFSPGSGTVKPIALYKYAKDDKGDDLYPSVAYGKGKWVVVWQSNDKLKKGVAAGKDSNIVFSTSKDVATWDYPQLISKNPALDGPNDATPHVTTDGKGNWLVAWVSTANISGTGTDNDILEAKSFDNASTWKALAPLNLNAAFDGSKSQYTLDISPRVATDGKGNWLAAWEGNSWAKSSENPGCQETAPTTLWKPSSYRTYVQYTDNFKSGWKDLFCIQPSTDKHHGEPSLSTDKTGNWVIPLSSEGPANLPLPGYPCDGKSLGNDTDILFAFTSNQELKKGIDIWGTCYPWYINTYADKDSAIDSYPAIATNGKTWIAVWQSDLEKLDVAGTTKNLGQDYDILVATSNDGKKWDATNVLNTNAEKDSGHDHHPSIATNGSEWVVVWESYDELSGKIDKDADILISTSSNGKSWSPAKPLHTNADSDSEKDQRPQIATDGNNWIVVWHSYEDGGTGKDADILVANFKLPLP